MAPRSRGLGPHPWNPAGSSKDGCTLGGGAGVINASWNICCLVLLRLLPFPFPAFLSLSFQRVSTVPRMRAKEYALPGPLGGGVRSLHMPLLPPPVCPMGNTVNSLPAGLHHQQNLPGGNNLHSIRGLLRLEFTRNAAKARSWRTRSADLGLRVGRGGAGPARRGRSVQALGAVQCRASYGSGAWRGEGGTCFPCS